MPKPPSIARAAATLACSFSALLGSAPALAADNPQKAQLAQSLFDEAKKLMAENRYAEACPKLAESERLDPSGGTVLHLGICHAAEGKTASAYAELNEALSVARRDGRSDRETVAKAHLAALSPKLVRLTVTVDADARVSGLEVTWNGTSLPEAQWGVAFPVDPGEHLVTATAPKRKRWSSRVDVRSPGSGASVTIPLLPRDSDQPPGSAATGASRPTGLPDATKPRLAGSTQRLAGLGLAAAGAIGLGIAGAFQLRALGLASERDDAARAGDAPAVATKHEEAKSSEVAAVVAAGIGAAALAAGLVLFLAAPRAPASSTTDRPASRAARAVGSASRGRAGALELLPFTPGAAGGGLLLDGRF